MSFIQELEDIKNWFGRLNPTGRLVLTFVFIIVTLWLSNAGNYLSGPLMLVLLWSLLTIENRTITLNSLILAGACGLMVVIPIAAIVSSPFMIFLHGYESIAIALNMIIEMLVMLSCLLATLWWPKSRLRYSSSILDFALIGLWLGGGLEWGILLLHQSPISFQGVAMGMFPQWPGLFGHPSKAFAAMSPAMVGLLFGVLIGLTRYLVGPDIKGMVRRVLLGLLIVLIMLWVVLERMAFRADELFTLPMMLYTIDLKGRLLAYLTAILTAVVIIVEWLLLREYKFISDLSQTINAYKTIWLHGQQTTLRTRFSNVIDLINQRSLIREIALAEETKALMSEVDKNNVEKRILVLRKSLLEGGWQG